MTYNMKKIIFYITAMMGGLAIAVPGWSQVSLFSTGYFQNQYLFNPAMSGVKNGEGALGAAYTKPTNIPNAPTTVALTGNYGFSESGAIGLALAQRKPEPLFGQGHRLTAER